MTNKRKESDWLNDLNHMFAIPSYEEWEEIAKASLKGQNVEKLFTKTYEGITLKPIYRKEHVSNEVPLLHAQNENNWMISQEIHVQSVDEANSTVKYVLEKGQTCINVNLNLLKIDEPHKLSELLDVISSYGASYFFKGENHFIPILLDYQKEKGIFLNGVMGKDLIGDWVVNGNLYTSLPSYYDEMGLLIKNVNTASINMKTILVESQPVHNGGANAVQELAYVFSVAIEYVSQLLKRGLTIDEIAPHFAFSFSVGSNLFMEIAKIRAAKFLWGAIVKEFGGSIHSQKIWIHAKTSLTTKTKYDPYVNMLRATVETFAAVVGGVNSIHTSTFDEAYEASSEFSERIARNVQSILKEESLLSRVIDPAGGSWYIESLTNELAKKAWEEIQKIDLEGGIISSLKNGSIQESVQKTREWHFEKIDYRKERIVGTNMYANVKEERIKHEVFHPYMLDINAGRQSIDKIEPITPIRWSMRFEALREHTWNMYEKTGQTMSIQLINLGLFAQHKPRTDFIRGFFEVGGFDVLNSGSFQTIEEVKEFLTTNNHNVYVICGQDDLYRELGKNVVDLIKTKSPSSIIYIAGKLDSSVLQAYKEMGLTDMVHVNTNCYQFLSNLQNKLEGYYEKA